MAYRRVLLELLVLVLNLSLPAQSMKMAVVRESIWRPLAVKHSERVWELLQPGLISSGSRLDPCHPVYNFLLEYYGFKGTKGCKRIARWSPPLMQTLMQKTPEIWNKFSPTLVESFSVKELCANVEVSAQLPETPGDSGGVLLENAVEGDLLELLHYRGMKLVSIQTNLFEQPINGALYNPTNHYSTQVAGDDCTNTDSSSGGFLFFQSILDATIKAEPIMHCHGLHEWAMQYRPERQPMPPSSKYQSHLPLRVDQQTINAAVERRGVFCTHVDALRFFAPAAKAWNQFGEYGTTVSRRDQTTLEQPGCVHANMDLLKYAMRVTPWIDGDLVGDALDIALQARKLDIASSPYDVSMYGLDPIPVETSEGRKIYREMQVDLLRNAQPVRQRILAAYNDFLLQTFAIQV
mmetsp:Transcript_11025/g.15899  ORF Transcript_11025/g.15899 Transcript_11025/m.15899 type:complete len:407 (-) Transcript_11025:1097-2317(-)